MKIKMKTFTVSMMLILIASIGTTNADVVGDMCFDPSNQMERAEARAICDQLAEDAGFISGNLRPCKENVKARRFCPLCKGLNAVFHTCFAHGPPIAQTSEPSFLDQLLARGATQSGFHGLLTARLEVDDSDNEDD